MSFDPNELAGLGMSEMAALGLTEMTAAIHELNEETKDTMQTFKNLTPFIGEVSDNLSMFKNLKPVNDTAKNVGKSKFVKGMKAVGGVFSKMLSAVTGGVVDKLTQFMQSLNPLGVILELISPVLEVITGIFEQSMAPVLQALMPVMIDFSMWLMDNKEAVMAVITVLNPLVLVLKLVAAAVSGDWSIMKGFVTFWTSVFHGVWTALVGAFKWAGKVFKGIKKMFVGAIMNIKKTIGGFFDWLDSLNPFSGGKKKSKKKKKGVLGMGGFLGIFQEGIPRVPRTGFGLIHRDEKITSAIDVAREGLERREQLFYSEQTYLLTRELVEMKMDARR